DIADAWTGRRSTSVTASAGTASAQGWRPRRRGPRAGGQGRRSRIRLRIRPVGILPSRNKLASLVLGWCLSNDHRNFLVRRSPSDLVYLDRPLDEIHSEFADR